LETVGSEPVVYYITTPAGQVPSYPENETPAPVKGYTYEKVKITSNPCGEDHGIEATNSVLQSEVQLDANL
jgi:hypothetical protein